MTDTEEEAAPITPRTGLGGFPPWFTLENLVSVSATASERVTKIQRAIRMLGLLRRVGMSRLCLCGSGFNYCQSFARIIKHVGALPQQP
ncbi:hypothetical protein E2C01_085670 [Portunus trituberculatus]|uniref:Uncharacterized protein n=1 Tax=Portunus trituberculatus TaxID=210409 RepID=A0A5B7J877_PORTR|nr:hypothetical protein [Portunus trituberculatus]